MKLKKLLALLLLGSVLASSFGCGSSSGDSSSKMTEEAEKVQSAINELPDDYSLEQDQAFMDVQELYDSLSDSEKQSLDTEKLDSLNEVREQLIDESASKLNDKINSLTLKYKSVSDLKKSKTDLKNIITLVNETPTAADVNVDYLALLDKMNPFIDNVYNSLAEKLNAAKKSPTEGIINELQEYNDASEDMIETFGDLNDLLKKRSDTLKELIEDKLG